MNDFGDFLTKYTSGAAGLNDFTPSALGVSRKPIDRAVPWAPGTSEFEAVGGYNDPLSRFLPDPNAPRIPPGGIMESSPPGLFDKFDSAVNQGADYLSQGIGALAQPINSVIGAAMKPIGSVLETAISPVNALFGALNESPLGNMAGGFGRGVSNYQNPGQQFDFSTMSPEQLQQMMEQYQAYLAATGGGGQTP